MMNGPALLTRHNPPAMVVRHAAILCDHGRLSPSRPILLAAIAICLVLAVQFCFGQSDHQVMTIPGVAALIAAAVMMTGLRPESDVYWNADGVEGPSAMLGLPFAPRSSFIAWESVVTIRTNGLGAGFVADAQGNRISWNLAYLGATQLRAHAVRSCPHLCGTPMHRR